MYASINLQLHDSPTWHRVRRFDVGNNPQYIDHESTAKSAQEVEKIVSALAKLISDLEIPISASISGSLIQHLSEKSIRQFHRLIEAGLLEINGETYYHSFAAHISHAEFVRQVDMHENLLQQIFGFVPTIFANTDLLHNKNIATSVQGLGYRGMVLPHIGAALGHLSGNAVYQTENEMRFVTSNPNMRKQLLSKLDPVQMELEATGTEVLFTNIHLSEFAAKGSMERFSKNIKEFKEWTSLNGMAFSSMSNIIETAVSPTTIELEANYADVQNHPLIMPFAKSSLHKPLIEQLKKLEEPLYQIDKQEWLSAWQQLQDHRNLHEINLHNSWSSKVFDSPYKSFMNLMNIIADLEINVQKQGWKFG